MSIELGILVSVLGLVIAFLGYKLNKQKHELDKQNYELDKQNSQKSETAEEVRSDTELKMQLNYISKGVDDIRIDLRSNDKRISEVKEELIRVEESTKQAHKRIDELSKGVKQA